MKRPRGPASLHELRERSRAERRVRDLGIAYPDAEDTIAASSVKVGDVKVFIVEWGAEAERKAEVFAHNSQLLAKTKTVKPLVWAPLAP